MKKAITILIIAISFLGNSQSNFQSLNDADWTLWNRNSHKAHMYVGGVITFIPSMVIAFEKKDGEDYNGMAKNYNGIKYGLKKTLPYSAGVILVKELVFNGMLGVRKATLPNLTYGLSGVLIGSVVSVLLYKVATYSEERNKYRNNLKL